MKCRIFPTLAAIALVAAGTLAAAPPLQAQTFPSEPITLIVAWPAGGGSDISMRLLADALSKQIKVPVVVLNKPGAGGAIGHREIVNAKPDGYTIGMFSSGGIALPYLNAQANTFDELQPIAFFGDDPSALEVSTASGIGSLKDYVEHARDLEVKLLLIERDGDERRSAGLVVAVLDLAGICARAFDERLERADPARCAYLQRIRIFAEKGNRLKFVECICLGIEVGQCDAT